MKNRELKSRIPFFTILGLNIILALAAASYMYHVKQDQEQQASEARLRMNEGIAQFREEQYEQSLQTLRSIPEGLLVDWHIPYYMGAALIQLKEYESAVLQLEKAHAMNPGDENIPFALGVAYYKLGNLSLSKAYFAAVLDLNPGNEEAKGLMDIMANLERNQPTAKPEEIKPNSDNGGESH